MAVSWDSVVVSAAVAAGVSVAVDLVLRPRLEVRKDRSLRQAREFDELSADLHALVSWLRDMRYVASSTLIGMNAENTVDLASRIGSLDSRALRTTWLPRPVQTELRAALGFLSGTVAAIAGIHDAPAVRNLPKDVQLPMIMALKARMIRNPPVLASFDLVLCYLDTPKWKLLRRKRLARMARRQVALRRGKATGAKVSIKDLYDAVAAATGAMLARAESSSSEPTLSEVAPPEAATQVSSAGTPGPAVGPDGLRDVQP